MLETIDFIEQAGGDRRDDCASYGCCYRIDSGAVEVAGWPAAWRVCSRCGTRTFQWLPESEASCFPELMTAGAELSGQHEAQGTLFRD